MQNVFFSASQPRLEGNEIREVSGIGIEHDAIRYNIRFLKLFAHVNSQMLLSQ